MGFLKNWWLAFNIRMIESTAQLIREFKATMVARMMILSGWRERESVPEVKCGRCNTESFIGHCVFDADEKGLYWTCPICGTIHVVDPNSLTEVTYRSKVLRVAREDGN